MLSSFCSILIVQLELENNEYVIYDLLIVEKFQINIRVKLHAFYIHKNVIPFYAAVSSRLIY